MGACQFQDSTMWFCNYPTPGFWISLLARLTRNKGERLASFNSTVIKTHNSYVNNRTVKGERKGSWNHGRIFQTFSGGTECYCLLIFCFLATVINKKIYLREDAKGDRKTHHLRTFPEFLHVHQCYIRRIFSKCALQYHYNPNDKTSKHKLDS